MTDALAGRLAALDTCAVSDALDRLGMPGAVVGIHALAGRRRIAGRVLTVRLEPAQDAPASQRHLCTAAVAAGQPGDVIVIDHGGRLNVAGWGGILSAAAVSRGLGGVVIDGACRDVDESRALGFPVYARAAVPLTARGRVVETAFNEPISMAGVPVQPGDLVIADGSGVVFVRADAAEVVIAAAETIAAREAEMARAVRAGVSVVEVMGHSYETLLQP